MSSWSVAIGSSLYKITPLIQLINSINSINPKRFLNDGMAESPYPSGFAPLLSNQFMNSHNLSTPGISVLALTSNAGKSLLNKKGGNKLPPLISSVNKKSFFPFYKITQAEMLSCILRQSGFFTFQLFQRIFHSFPVAFVHFG